MTAISYSVWVEGETAPRFMGLQWQSANAHAQRIAYNETVRTRVQIAYGDLIEVNRPSANTHAQQIADNKEATTPMPVVVQIAFTPKQQKTLETIEMAADSWNTLIGIAMFLVAVTSIIELFKWLMGYPGNSGLALCGGLVLAWIAWKVIEALWKPLKALVFREVKPVVNEIEALADWIVKDADAEQQRAHTAKMTELDEQIATLESLRRQGADK